MIVTESPPSNETLVNPENPLMIFQQVLQSAAAVTMQKEIPTGSNTSLDIKLDQVKDGDIPIVAQFAKINEQMERTNGNADSNLIAYRYRTISDVYRRRYADIASDYVANMGPWIKYLFEHSGYPRKQYGKVLNTLTRHIANPALGQVKPHTFNGFNEDVLKKQPEKPYRSTDLMQGIEFTRTPEGEGKVYCNILKTMWDRENPGPDLRPSIAFIDEIYRKMGLIQEGETRTDVMKRYPPVEDEQLARDLKYVDENKLNTVAYFIKVSGDKLKGFSPEDSLIIPIKGEPTNNIWMELSQATIDKIIKGTYSPTTVAPLPQIPSV